VEQSRIVTGEDVWKFAAVSGDRNLIHTDAAYAATTPFERPIVHGALLGAFISGLVGNELPGPGCFVVSLQLDFRSPVYIGANVTTRVEIVKLEPRWGFVVLSCSTMADQKKAIKGEVRVMVPKRGEGKHEV
jgi:3-hydroxybutyryl-CoA dehydratase